jgi:uncharacterized protein (TIGR02646 family)
MGKTRLKEGVKMRQVKRSAVQAPKEIDLNDSTSAGSKEREKAILFYQDNANKELAFTYKVYKLKSIQEKIEALFHGKCAYCESNYQGLHPVDVEHYRPKGGVTINDTLAKPGYYWLACEWHNLLPSCIDCNRERNQKQADGTTIKTGKANKFPILVEAKRAKQPDTEKLENRLLLDPCRDIPEKHLEFTEEGIIRPAVSNAGKISRKGDESIKVYGLQRIGLVERRREHALLILAQIQRVREFTEDLDRDPDNSQIEARLEREMKELKRYLSPEKEYTGLAKQLITAFLDSL